MTAIAAKTTPRPWRAVAHNDNNNRWTIDGGAFDRPVQTPGHLFSTADAALIVQAVNAHDDLVGALRELVSLIPKKFTTAPAFDNARALLRDLDGASQQEEGL